MMLRSRKISLAIAATTITISMSSLAAEPPIQLQRNPFERPALEEQTTAITALNEESTAGHRLGLRAVLVAGRKSVVDFGGVILQIGESANGYVLLSVEEDKATFSRNNKEVTFWLNGRGSSEER